MNPKLIEQNGKHYQEANVIMLATKKNNTVGSIVKRPSDGRLAVINVLTTGDPQECINQHLYIASNEAATTGEWCYSIRGFVGKFGEFENSYSNECRLLTASTDKSLGLPEPYPEFIQAYIEAYNSGNKIEKVLVEVEMTREYGQTVKNINFNPTVIPFCTDAAKLKLKDNTITIKKKEETWDDIFEEYKCSKYQWGIDGINLFLINNYNPPIRK